MTGGAPFGGRTVLLTRAAHQATGTAARLIARGHRAVIAPLVRIERLPARIPPGAQAILVTSRNGADALVAATPDRRVPLLAVGNATAGALRESGFIDVQSANGDASALAALALSRLDPSNGPVIHARGAEIRRSPLDALRGAGFDTGEAVLYRTVSLDTLPDAARTCDTVLIYSPGSARRLLKALTPFPPLDIVAISPAALSPLQDTPAARMHVAGMHVARMHVAPHPDENAMLDLLDTLPKIPVAPTPPLR